MSLNPVLINLDRVNFIISIIFKTSKMKNNFLKEMSIEDLEERNEFTAIVESNPCIEVGVIIKFC